MYNVKIVARTYNDARYIAEHCAIPTNCWQYIHDADKLRGAQNFTLLVVDPVGYAEDYEYWDRREETLQIALHLKVCILHIYDNRM